MKKPNSTPMKTIPLRRPVAALFVCVGTFLVCVPSQADDRDYRPGLVGRIFGPPPHAPRRLVRVRVIRRQPAPESYQAAGAPEVIYSDDPAANASAPVSNASTTTRPIQRMQIPINANRPILRSEYSNALGSRQLDSSIQLDEYGRPVTSTPSDASAPTSNSRSPQLNGASALAPNPSRLSSGDNGELQTTKTDAARPSTQVQDKTEMKASKPVPPASSYPMGTRSTKPGFVKSPYEPFNELDATGLYAGMLARDPTTGKIFRVP
jgi:hypothetical protein